jgi:transcriptional regulator with XRE-family HTH domain
LSDVVAIGAAMRDHRKLRGLTQAGAAEALGVTERTYARWETGETSGALGQLHRIAEVFGCSREDLLQGRPVGLEEKVDELLAWSRAIAAHLGVSAP